MAAIAIMFATTLFAQTTATKNVYSIYSMYGIGDLATQGTLPTRSMGGAGLALRNGASINLLNPASYSVAVQKGILMDFGAEGGVATNSQPQASGLNSSTYGMAKLNNIAIQVPITKDLGVGFSVAPYSTIGYYIEDSSYDMSTGGNYMVLNHQGSGEITEVKLGVGYKLAKGLHVGIAAQYYWGQLTRYYSLSLYPIIGSTNFSTAQGVDSYYFSKVKGQVGIQWEAIAEPTKRLIFGATYDLGGNLAPELTKLMMSGSSTDLIYFYATDEEIYPEINIPHKLSVGGMYQTKKWSYAADATYQDWSDNNSTITTEGLEVAYRKVAQVRLGVEYIPNRMDVRTYYKRMSYRFGVRAGNYYKSVDGQRMPQWAITTGIGMPMGMLSLSNVDIGLEYGSAGSHKTVGSGDAAVNLIKQNYFKVSVGITLFGDDYWFQRPKYD